MSKGSKRRPTQLSAKELAERWELAFGKKTGHRKVQRSQKALAESAGYKSGNALET